jgi:hypothetical protein
MGVRIDKAWQRDTAAKVQPFCGSRLRECFDFCTGSHCGNQTIANQQGPIFDNAEVGKRRAAPRAAIAQCQKL